MRSIREAPAPIERGTGRVPVGRPSLMAFVADAETERVLRDCLAHLAVSHGEIMRGGIAKAIDFLGTQRSPNTLIVDITGVDLPVSQIRALEEVCEPGVVVIAIGARNEIGLYRDLLQAGVSEYVVKPLNAQLLSRALSAGGRAGGLLSSISTCRTATARWRSTSNPPPGCARPSSTRHASTTPCSNA